jgi:TusA-related sulfurtransferase
MAEIIWNAGFEAISFGDERYDTFSDAPQASSAAAFGTQGVNIWAVKPVGVRHGAAPTASRPALPDPVVPNGAAVPAPDDVFDAGALGCGDGPLLTIAARLRGMQPGQVLEVRSTDPGVAADLPAWCRMVGHTFLGGGQGEHAGRYFVRRKA